MNKSTQLYKLRHQLVKLDNEKARIEAEIEQLLTDPQLAQEEADRARYSALEADMRLASMYLPDRYVRAYLDGGLRDLRQLIDWLDHQSFSIAGIGKRQVNETRKRLKQAVQMRKAEVYGQETLAGMHAVLPGMHVTFPKALAPEQSRPVYHESAWGGVLRNSESNPICIDVEVYWLGTSAIVSIPFTDLSSISPGRDNLEQLVPLAECDEHELLQELNA